MGKEYISCNLSQSYFVDEHLPTFSLTDCWITERGGESIIEKFNPF
jgi:hypothetical protein